MINAQDQAAGA
jgi:hypothetical protein